MSQNIVSIKNLLESIYEIIDHIDAKGVPVNNLISKDSGLKEIVQKDMLLSIIHCSSKDETINEDCLEYVNDVLGCNFTKLTFELTRKEVFEQEIPQMCVALPFFIVIDRSFGGNQLSSIYIKALAYITLGYIKCEEHQSLEEMVSYYRLCSACTQLVENTLEEKIDFDPLFMIKKGRELELIKHAVEIDKLINKKNPIFDAIEKGLCDVLTEDSEMVKESAEAMDLLSIEKLDALIGLCEVKEQVHTLVNVLKVRRKCEELEIKRADISLHMVFTGNPGTGKTTVARILGEIYKEAGVLSKGHLVEVSRAELVDKYAGHTAIRVKRMFNKAKGGILFIDEAYSLTSEGDSFGQEAVETLLKLMEDNRDDIAVIVAGYPALMQEFLESNPGLRSRFPTVIKFPDYSGNQLTHIFLRFCKENHIIASRDVINAAKVYFRNEASKKHKNFGNARIARNYFEKMIMNQANRLVQSGHMEKRYLCRFTREDLPKTLEIKPMKSMEQHV